jgi:hypothetical protein
MFQNVYGRKHKLRAEASRQPRQCARSPAGTLHWNSRADPFEIFSPELRVRVFDRGELSKDCARLRIGFRIREGSIQACAVNFALEIRLISCRIRIWPHGLFLTF